VGVEAGEEGADAELELVVGGDPGQQRGELDVVGELARGEGGEKGPHAADELVALGVAAMFPSGQSPERGVALGFAVYNASATVILSVAGVAGAADGWLLWPVVGIHGILVVMLIVLSFRVGRTS
jgi:hypothetical protein